MDRPPSKRIIPETNITEPGDLERTKYEKKSQEIRNRISTLDIEIQELENLEREIKRKEQQTFDSITTSTEVAQETTRVENIIADITERMDEKNDAIIERELEKTKEKIKDKTSKKRITTFLQKIRNTTSKALKRRLIKYFFLPFGVVTPVALTYQNPQEFYEMAQNWTERHLEKADVDDPSIKGVDILYNKTTSVEKTTYDFLGPEKIDYKSGYYITSVFDLSDRTPPRFKVLNEDRKNYKQIEDVAGITTNLFKPFYQPSKLKPELKGHFGENALERGEIPVIAYNIKTQTIRAGHLKDFNDDEWLISETYEVPLNFKLNADKTINLTYPKATLRMTPLTTNEKGAQIAFPIGITKNKNLKTFDPYKATNFGVLEGGKVIMVCGDKQLQVNGSFADMFRVYERLQKEYPNIPIQAFFLDNGSFNLPIWDKDQDGVITAETVRQHMTRHYGGGTALILMNDEKISPYEYKNNYQEIQHYIEGDTVDEKTGKPVKNEKSVIVIHHTGNYADPNKIIQEFKDPSKERSAHVLILKDGTRHLFNTDNSVLAHAGKSDFNDRNKVNYFSLGVELEGDSQNEKQFTLAQMESMLEYLRPRIEKYNIPIENITTHKIIRDNYLRKHPEEKEVPKKVDLNDEIWEQLRKLIAKKLYAEEKPKLTEDAVKLMGAIAYQEAYRVTQNKDFAFNKIGEILQAFDAQGKIKKTESWVRNSS